MNSPTNFIVMTSESVSLVRLPLVLSFSGYFFHKVVWNTVDGDDIFLKANIRGSFLMSCVTFIKVISHDGSTSGVMCFSVSWPQLINYFMLGNV